MPLDGYLWLGGAHGISGEAKHHRYTDWVNVSNLEWGVRQQAPVDANATEHAPVAEVDAVSFTHDLDRASIGLFQACCTGRNLPEVRFVTLQPDVRGGQAERLRIVFRDCLITGLQVSVEEGRVSEKVEMVFVEVDVEAQPRPVDVGR